MKRAIMLGVLSICVFLVACSADGEPKTDEKKQEETVTIKHEFGEDEIPKNPKNIVVFDFGILDTLDKLDVEVAGVPQGSVPAYLEKYTDEKYINTGASREPDFEVISEMAPDLIIISGREAEVYEEVKKIAPTIYLPIDFTNYTESFTNNMETIGKIFDKEDQMAEELKILDEKLNLVKDKVAQTNDETLILMANEGKISAYGPGSRYGGMIHDEAGYQPVDKDIEDARYGQNVNFEYVMEKNPEVIFVVDRNAALNADHTGTKKSLENDLFKKTNAYKNNQVFFLNMDGWFFGGGLQSMDIMIEDLDTF